MRFTVADESALLARVPDAAGQGDLSVVIWTTTPWTLPANQAVALNPELEYVVLQTATERLIVAEALLEAVLQRAEISEHTILARCTGDKLEGLLLQHPFMRGKSP